MNDPCALCRTTVQADYCYVRFEEKERSTCRTCWEQLFLDPRRILRAIQESGLGLPSPIPSAF